MAGYTLSEEEQMKIAIEKSLQEERQRKWTKIPKVEQPILLVSGYVRQNDNAQITAIPKDIYGVVMDFYFSMYHI